MMTHPSRHIVPSRRKERRRKKTFSNLEFRSAAHCTHTTSVVVHERTYGCYILLVCRHIPIYLSMRYSSSTANFAACQFVGQVKLELICWLTGWLHRVSSFFIIGSSSVFARQEQNRALTNRPSFVSWQDVRFSFC